MDFNAALTPQQRAAAHTIINALDPEVDAHKRTGLLTKIALETMAHAPHSGAYIGGLIGFVLALTSDYPGATHDLCNTLRAAMADEESLNGGGE